MNYASGELNGAGGVTKLEPKVAALLEALAGAPGQVLSRDALMAEIWGDVVVGDDSLARLVSKLRQALGDDAREPRYVETMSKRGYRLVARVSPVVMTEQQAPAGTSLARWPYFVPLAAFGLMLTAWFVLSSPNQSRVELASDALRPEAPPRAASLPASAQSAALMTRAEDAYYQFSRGDNEAAISLYTRVLSLNPEDASALAGLANALVQRALRWPVVDGQTREFASLRDALAAGHLAVEPAVSQLQRAEGLARRAIELTPTEAGAHKALGFVVSAQGRLDEALAAYDRTLALDPDNWGALINSGELLGMAGNNEDALTYFERAFDAMDRAYADNAVRVRPWQSVIGVNIADRYVALGDELRAESWYRRVIAQSPLHPAATRGLAAILSARGDQQAAQRLCEELAQRLGTQASCP